MRPSTKVEGDEPSGSSAERSLRLLAQLASGGQVLGVNELAQRLALPKATAHRLCVQLVAGGWLARETDEKRFAIGPALRRLALDTLNHGEQRGLRHAVLDALVQEVGETCTFTTLDGAEVVYLDRVEARWPLRLTLDVGAHVPLHCSASGKLFLAHMAPARRDARLEQLALSAKTPNTHTNRQALREECEAIRARGYSTDDEEYIVGLMAVAVPVLDDSGQVRAALAVHAPSARMPLPRRV
jgi:DNA-binding IclR family transcriptional regulator